MVVGRFEIFVATLGSFYASQAPLLEGKVYIYRKGRYSCMSYPFIRETEE
jgi:hypothetical protein